MKAGVLFSGGKDSTYASYLAKKNGLDISCLISIFSKNPYSYMFHTPEINKVKIQAEAMEIPIIIQETEGEKELELNDLKKAIQKAINNYNIDCIITGAVESIYQKSRVEKICDELNLNCIDPLWHKNPEEYWDEIIKDQFEIIIISVAAEGFDESWLGQKIDKNSLEKLKKIRQKYRIHLLFEGGEAETFVIDCPLFHKKLKIIESEKIFSKNNGTYKIKKIVLEDK